jgi:hypothetical protein
LASEFFPLPEFEAAVYDTVLYPLIMRHV